MVMAAAVATQLGMSASSFLCPSSIISNQVELPTCAPSTLVLCQRDSLKRRTAAAYVSRRVLAVASASAAAAALGVFTQPEAAQAKRNKPPPEEKKKVEPEEKSLGVNEQRALANARRKDAMKASVAAAKAKAKSISSPQSE